jgi:serine protease Do
VASNVLKAYTWTLVAASVAAASSLAYGGEAIPARPTTAGPARETRSTAAHLEAPRVAGQPPSLAPLVEEVRKTVVGVTTHIELQVPERMQELLRRFLGQGVGPVGPQEEIGIGSGMIIDPTGLVLTNNHVVKGATEVRVRTADGTDYTATVKGTDPETDIAVLQLHDVKEPLPAARLGRSDRLRVGDFVIAIGNPYGLTLTVTNGIISAKSRVIGIGPYDEFLQTDAAINPGNSGGPLFDLDGNVVGINTAISAQGQNIGFAVPIDLARSLLPQLVEKGKVVRGYLGVGTQDMTAELARGLGVNATRGALVAIVEANGPGAKAGIKDGDVIVGVNGRPVEGAAQLSRDLAVVAPGQQVQIRYERGPRTEETTATLAEPPSSPEDRGEGEGQPREEGSLGLTLHPLPSDFGREVGVSQGALVTAVEPGSRADDAGLEPGDVIVEADHEPVAGPRDLMAIVRAEPKASLLVRVVSKEGARYVVVPEQED